MSIILKDQDAIDYLDFEKFTTCPFTLSKFHDLNTYKCIASFYTKHQTDYCFIGHRNGVTYHVFKNITITCDATSKTLIDTLYNEKSEQYNYIKKVDGLYYFITRLENENSSSYIFDLPLLSSDDNGCYYNWATRNSRTKITSHSSSLPLTSLTLLPPDRYSTQAADLEATNVLRKRIYVLIQTYFTELHPLLNKQCKDKKIILHLPPRDLFDTILINGIFYPLKLVNILPANVNFYNEMRNCLFYIVQNYATTHLEFVKQQKLYKTREKIQCDSIDYLSQVYKCNTKNCLNGSFLKNYKKGVAPLPPLPTIKFCEHVFYDALDNGYDEKEILQTWNFKCQFAAHETSTVDNSTIMRAWKILFGRKEPMHRNCMPDSFIKKDWLDWLLN